MVKVYDSLKEKIVAKERSDKNFLLLLAFILALALAVVVVNTYVLFRVEVVGMSMNPTLNSGDILVVNAKRTPECGDIVIIDGEKGDAWLIKRVIAKGGQTVEIKDGFVFVDGEKLNEDYIEEGVKTESLDWTARTLDEGEVFYLGDNRKKGMSSDSRTASFSTCDESQILGVVPDWSLSARWFNGLLFKAVRGE
jgi:signal peptidase I